MILSYLFEVHRKARSRKSVRVPTSVLKKELKKSDLKEAEIVHNLDYLIQSNWVDVETEESEFKTPKGFTRKQTKEYYKISDSGINQFEGTSQYQRVDSSIAGIKVTNVQGVTIVGNQNVVNAQFPELYRTLSLLSESVRASTLTDEDKLNFSKDIETIKDQLSKPAPDRGIIRLAWEKLKPLATVSGVITLFEQASKLIGALLGRS